MSLTFPTGIQQKPSGVTGLPNRFTRPSFGTIYGFDAVGGVDGALLTESGDFLMTESGDFILTEVNNTYTNSDSSLSVTLSGFNATFDFVAITGASTYRLVVWKTVGSEVNAFITAPTLTYNTGDMSFSPWNAVSGDTFYAYYKDNSAGTQSPTVTFNF